MQREEHLRILNFSQKKSFRNKIFAAEKTILEKLFNVNYNFLIRQYRRNLDKTLFELVSLIFGFWYIKALARGFMCISSGFNVES